MDEDKVTIISTILLVGALFSIGMTGDAAALPVTVDGTIGAGVTEYANSVPVEKSSDLGGFYDPGTSGSFAGGPVNGHDDWTLYWDFDETNIYIAADPLGAGSSVADAEIGVHFLPALGNPNTGVGFTDCTGTFIRILAHQGTGFFSLTCLFIMDPGFTGFTFTGDSGSTPLSAGEIFKQDPISTTITPIEWNIVRADLDRQGDTTYTGDLQCVWFRVSAFDSRGVDNGSGPGSRTIWIKLDQNSPNCEEESAAADHYLGYKVKETKHTDKFEKITVILSDQFETDAVYIVEKPERLYNPVDKNGEGISDEITHLLGYKIKAPKDQPKFETVTNVLVTNQFGDIIVDVKKPKLLLVPSLKDLIAIPDIPNPITINHYKCYDVKVTKDTPKFEKREVTLTDPNFGETKVFEVKKPKHLCVPVDKEGEGIIDPENHLMCYDLKKIKDQPKFEKRNVFTNNQFEPEDLEVKKEHQLCVPSVKTLL